MEQMRPTQFRYHQVLHEDRRRVLRGCDDRTYAHVCAGRTRRRRPKGLSGILRRVAGVVRMVGRRGPQPVHQTPTPAAGDPAPVVAQDEPVVCIDLSNPPAGATKPSPGRPSDGHN